MPVNTRNSSNTGQGTMQTGRVPSRQRQSPPVQEAERREEASPLIAMSRRIRDEQGVDGLRQFLAAMGPFAAPNELKTTAARFGMDYESILSANSEQRAGETRRGNGGSAQNAEAYGSGRPNGPGGFAPVNGMGGQDAQLYKMMQLMQMMNAVNQTGAMNGAGTAPRGKQSGQDPMAVMRMMQLMPMMRSMMNGGDPSALASMMKMMGG